MGEKKEKITISVVVIGRNEGYRLVNCLDSVHRISYPKEDYELIYVDSNSTDDSVVNAKEKGATVIEINASQPTAALARNTGWNQAKGKYILFLDSDTILDPSFISHAITEFSNPHVAIVSGNLKERHPEETVYNRAFNLDWNHASRNYCGGNALIRKEALVKVNGYNPKLIAGEEPEMCQRLIAEGYQIKHLNVPMASHDLNMQTFSQYWKRCFRSGYAYASISKILKNSSRPLWRKESQHNLTKGGLMICGLIASILCIFTPLTFYPLSLYVIINTMLIFRTFLIKISNHSWKTAFLYGIHAHFQHIPMFFGQLSFLINQKRAINRDIIEYK